MNPLVNKAKKLAFDSLHCLGRAYFQQREKELRSSRDKWKKKAMDRQATISELEKELRGTRQELKKIDSQQSG